jgi:hypothetical protein
MAATLQQAAGLHPFVTDMKIVNPMIYPTIETVNVNTKEWCQPVITNDFNMYTIVTEPITITVIVDELEQTKDVSQARLVKFQRQYFHENYFVATTATLPGGSPVIIPTDALYIDTTLFYPMLTYAVQQNILFILVNREVEDFNGDLTAFMVLTAYEVNDGTKGGHDVKQLWEKTWTPVQTDLYGTMLGGDGKIYWYKLDDTVLSIRTFDRINGTEEVKTITLDQTYSYCKLTMSLVNINTYYITVRAGNIIRMATGLLNASTLSAFITVATASGVSVPTQPEVLAFANEGAEKPMCSVIHGYNYDTNNILRVVYIPNILNTDNITITGLETPFYYNLNKFQLFSEVQNQTQSDVSVSVTCNPNNANFSYIAYVATTSQIRIVKLYRNKVAGTSYETHVPLVMWGTRLGVIKDTVNGKVGVNVDTNGNVYVFTWSDDGNIQISKIREYIMDLGHTEGTVIAPIDTIPNMLRDMTQEYTILTPRQGFLYSTFPIINDVTIDTVVNANGLQLDIKFNYVNYTYLQAFPDLVIEIRNRITNTFRDLYGDSSITVINLDETAIGLEGDAYSLNVYLPIGTSKKPCVVKGTEIIRRTHEKAELIEVEHIRIGDMVLNHEGNYVKVLDHLCSTIYAQEHNAPFLVPRGFFGVNRPYKDLLISGDHGILVHYQSARNMKVEYAENIRVLKRVLLGITVEFHHLQLESHQDNFYVANGLEVDSYHPVAFMRS